MLVYFFLKRLPKRIVAILDISMMLDEKISSVNGQLYNFTLRNKLE
jgi:hypothetical protein